MKCIYIFCCLLFQPAIAYYKKNLCVVPSSYINPLIATDDLKKLHELILDGTPINTAYDYIPPLLDALLKNKRDKALFLLQYGAQPNCIKDGITPLRWAIEHHDYELSLSLLRAQAKLHKKDILLAQKIGTESLYKLLSYTLEYRALGKYYLSTLDKHGLSLIHQAAITGCKEQIDALILVGVPFNLRSCEDKTVLHYLAEKNNVSLFNYLSKRYNCKIHIKDFAKNTQQNLSPDNLCKNT